MKIVLKELMNRVGLPTDSLICALTTYMGLGGSATAMLHGESAHNSSAGRLRAFSAQYPPLRKGLGSVRAPQQSCTGGTRDFGKTLKIHTFKSFCHLLSFLFSTFLIYIRKLIVREKIRDNRSPRGNNERLLVKNS